MSTVLILILSCLIYFFCFLIIIYVFIFSISLLRGVPFVRSEKRVINEALKYLNISNKDIFVDIGSGDGFVIFKCAKTYKAKKYIGLELDRFLIFFSNFLKILSKQKDNISFVNINAFNYNYSKSNKIYMYLTTELVSSLMPKLQKELPKNTEVVSCVFGFGKDFEKKNKVERKIVVCGEKKYTLTKWIKK